MLLPRSAVRTLLGPLSLALALSCGDDKGGNDGSSGNGGGEDGATADDGDGSGDGSSSSAGDGNGSDGATDDGGDGSGSGTDATSGGGCTIPDPDQDFIHPYQDELVAQLTGAQPLPGGGTLTDRSSGPGREAARAYLIERFSDLGLSGERHDYGSGTNVFAELVATTGSEQTLVLGAHFDSVPSSPGANDNATGVAIVLALARYLTQVECRKINVAFVLFDEEEIGLIGSAAFAQMLVDNGVDVLAAHTYDQMGWDGDSDRAIELERPDAGMLDLYQAAVDQNTLGIPLQQTQTGGTDHVSFRAVGIPAVGITEEFFGGDTTPYYHQPGDGYDTVDFSYLRSTTVLAAHVMAGLVAE